ncbi:MAG: PLP-dependent aminotransferase family protein [Pseudomonadota bacterium]
MPFRYDTLADEIESKITTGVYKSGERLPSIRRLQATTGYSLTTVYRAFIELEQRGLVSPREKSGYFVKARSGILPVPDVKHYRPRAQKVTINSLAGAIVEAMGDLSYLQLGGTLTAPGLLPVKALGNFLKAMPAKRIRDAFTTYEHPCGNPGLRHQLARRSVNLFQGVDAEEVIVTGGCIEAVSFCLRAVAGPGSTVIVASPTYPWFLQIIEDLNMLALELPTDPRTGIDLDAMERAVSEHPVAACILVPNFHNPLGFLMPEDRKQRIVRFLNGKNIPVIEDDIHGELYFGGVRPSTLKSYDRKGLIMYCSSFSKMLAPGLRVGWTLPGRFRDAVRRLKLNHTIAAPSLNQQVIAEFMTGGAFDRHMRKLRSALKHQVSQMTTAIAQAFPAGTRITSPMGGLMLWVELDPSVDGLAVFNAARRERIAILPGIMCSTTGRYGNFIRISCGFPMDAAISRGIDTLGSIVSRMTAEAHHRVRQRA